MEEYKKVEIEEKQYVVIEKINYNSKEYFVLSQIEDETLYDNFLIGTVKNGRFMPIEEEEELVNVKKQILMQIKEEI